MFEPVKVGLTEFLQVFHASVLATTPAVEEFSARGFSDSVVWAPSSMVETAEEMLSQWQRNDTHQGPTRPPSLPVMVVALPKGSAPDSREITTQAVESVGVTFPHDSKRRLFRMSTKDCDVRTQVAIFAGDGLTARSLALQLTLFLESLDRPALTIPYPFAGLYHAFPAQIDLPENSAMAIETGSKDLAAVAINLVLKVVVPTFMAPQPGEPHDGKGVPGTDDPAGYSIESMFDSQEETVTCH